MIAFVSLLFTGACDEQSSYGNTVRSQVPESVDSLQRRAERSDRVRERRDRRRDRRGNRRGSRGSVDLLPHRGDYIIEVSGYNTTTYVNAKGTLTIDLIDDCDDWTLQEKLDVVLYDQAKKTYRSNLLYRATEMASADRFVFAYSRDHLGEREDYIGDVRPAPEGFLTHFSEPKITDLLLPGDVSFPISHFRQVLANASGQGGAFEAVVFDGGNAIAYLAVTEIGLPLRSKESNHRIVAARKMLERNTSDRLPAGATWPVTTSYYPLDNPYAAPVFTRDFLLHETGIMIGLHLNYGDLQMDAKLANLDIFEPSRCAPAKGR
ncbi:MAG: EipB family protein [Geminicoccaceae bacterium]